MSLSYARPILYEEWMAPEVFITADLLFWRVEVPRAFWCAWISQVIYLLNIEMIYDLILQKKSTVEAGQYLTEFSSLESFVKYS